MRMKPEVNLGSLTLSEQVFSDSCLEGGAHILGDTMNPKVSNTSVSLVGTVTKPVISLSLSSITSTSSINRASEKDHNSVMIDVHPQAKNKHVHGFRKDWESSLISDMISKRVPLKYSKEEKEASRSHAEESRSECDSSDISITSTVAIGSDPITASRKRKHCFFNEYVDVISIPNRNEYSKRIRAKLWSTAVELHLNASRNTIEFAADGWDWRSATEEDKMTKCPDTGETIHPIHLCMNTESCQSSGERVASQTDKYITHTRIYLDVECDILDSNRDMQLSFGQLADRIDLVYNFRKRIVNHLLLFLGNCVASVIPAVETLLVPIELQATTREHGQSNQSDSCIWILEND